MDEKDFYWYWFANIAGIGIKTQQRLLEHFVHPKHIYHEKEKTFESLLTEKQKKSLQISKNPEKIMKSQKRLAQRGFRFMHRESPEYPKRLLALYDPPTVLYYKGTLPDFSRPVLAVVGARRATLYGRNMARKFAQILASEGVQIVSGLAAGVDAAGHEGALEGSGYTVGVVGGGIDTIYPRGNEQLYYRVYASGCVLSEYNLGIPNQKGLFPVRNRIISGLSDGVFVVEAGERSGSLITADQGLEQGKDIFALPGRITDPLSSGCNNLISQGAVLVRTPEDILEVLTGEICAGKRSAEKIERKDRKLKEFSDKDEQAVYELTDEITPVSFGYLLEKTGITQEKLHHILMKFELENMIFQAGYGLYLRKNEE